jgi:hypothetical protein
VRDIQYGLISGRELQTSVQNNPMTSVQNNPMRPAQTRQER